MKDIARTSLASRKEAQLLFRLVNFLQPRCSVELGTSLGITASYIASASSKICLTTIEGSENIAAEAQKVFEKLRLKNIRQVVGNIDVCLPQFLKEADVVDFAFLDANHTEKATLRYFMQLLPHCGQKTVLVLDDIHYSVGMNNAWRAICRLPEVTAAMDLWDLGIVFFNKQLEKRIYKIRI